MKFPRELLVRFGLAAVTFASMLWGFRLLLLEHAPTCFDSDIEDMSYGWYVPLFSLYVVWTERRRILDSLGSPSLAGLPVLALGFLFGFLGARGSQIRFEIVGFVLMLLGLVWTHFGVRAMRSVVFPAMFLLFCLPLHSFLDIITIHLRMLAVSVSHFILAGCGAEVVRNGTMLASPTGAFSIDVAEPCSGLRSIFALTALTAGYAYFNQPTWTRRALLFATSVPLAILGNVARILSIALTAAFFDAEFATGFYHDYSGYVVFVFAISLMLAASGLLNRVFGERPRPEAADAGGVPQPGASGRYALPAVACALVVAAMTWQAVTPSPVLCEEPGVRLADLTGFERRVREASESEKTVLPADTVIDRSDYVDEAGDWFSATIVVGGSSKSSVHRPEMCLPAQGLQMTNPATDEVAGRSWRFLDLASRDRTMSFAYTFFNQDGFRTSSHVSRIFRDVVDRSFLNRIDRWVMVTVTSSADRAKLGWFLEKLENRVLGGVR